MGFSLEKLSFILNPIYCYKNAQIVSLTDGYQDTKPYLPVCQSKCVRVLCGDVLQNKCVKMLSLTPS